MKLSMPVFPWIRYAVAFVFITSGAMKLIGQDFESLFAGLGVPYPEQTLLLTALAEIACGALIAVRYYVKQAAIPLFVIMLGALYFAKLPVLMNKGFVTFLFEARLDLVMIILLLLLFQHSRMKH